ncbi:dihydroorotate dehydrogenase [Alkalithermobacter paradoxus]|uniref:Dihydroorotate dehydrogenase n=1 Tax=Alkalithermobacter paradoxus TaxID=29349 RepID=A0A1V4I7P5_9FIRM|nr:dihydroorotate dehydrogenase B, catalytic subunit [[Clostridium] thermoalcaliphilum]
MPNLSVKFGKLNFKNPVVMASGTFGFGKEYERIYDIQKLGGICTKGITLNKRDGNNGIRVWETASGMLNSVGLENPGIDKFVEEYNDYLKLLDTVSIVNIGGSTIDEYIESVEIACKNNVDAIELNISCPNVKEGGIAFGIRTDIARQVVRKVRDVCNVPLIVKLSPNAENIVNMAVMCEEEGADGVSLVNTFMGMAIDIDKRKAIFDNMYAGLSGPCIKPMALRMVHQVCKNVSIPVVGMGGISNHKDALEFIMAGATCIQVGTANFINPRIGIDIIDGINEYMKKENIKSLDEIRGII